jgi:hypothetical protein
MFYRQALATAEETSLDSREDNDGSNCMLVPAAEVFAAVVTEVTCCALQPLLALSVLGMPINKLPTEVISVS